MDNIIKFEKAEEESIEDTFIKSLTDEQNEMFFEIITNIQEDYEKLQSRLVKKIAECEMLRLENMALKGGINET